MSSPATLIKNDTTASSKKIPPDTRSSSTTTVRMFEKRAPSVDTEVGGGKGKKRIQHAVGGQANDETRNLERISFPAGSFGGDGSEELSAYPHQAPVNAQKLQAIHGGKGVAPFNYSREIGGMSDSDASEESPLRESSGETCEPSKARVAKKHPQPTK